MLERVHYFPEQLVTAEDLNEQAEFVLNKLRRHNRYLHGFGIVCGLEVTGPDDDDPSFQIRVEPGYGLSPCGNEVMVADGFAWDLEPEIYGGGACVKVDSKSADLVFYPALRPIDCLVRPVRVRAETCACGEPTCEYSRIRESFETCLLDELPESFTTRTKVYQDAVRRKRTARPCLPCPTDDWLVLAKVVVSQGRAQVDTAPSPGFQILPYYLWA